ncbi:alpha/beta hydrolase, partial [Mycobacterium kyorinense]
VDEQLWVFQRGRTRLFEDEVWSGQAANAANAKHQQQISTLQAHVNGSAAAAKLYRDSAGVVTSTKQQIIENVEKTQQLIEKIANDPQATPEQKDYFIKGLVRETHAENVQLVQAGATKLSKPPATPLTVRPASNGREVPLAPPPQDTAPQIPKAGTDPNEVKRWWDSLSQPQKDQLLREHPDMLGNLDGIYVADRSTANTTVMQQDLDRVTHAASDHHVSIDEVTAHPQNYGLSPADVTRYTNAVQVKKGLEYNSAKTHAPTFLQVYEPDKFNGQGRAAIAIGNPDTAANTAVVVPGTSHSVTEGWLSSNDAANLYNETWAANHGKATSVVAWMGYNAPDSLGDPQVGQTGLAHQGGALLASDVNALNVTHQGASDVTVIGHSYGSTTVADAAAGYGMHANDVVLIGCPGTDMAHSAADFHLAQGGHVYVGSASTDPITQLGGIPQVHAPGTDVTVALGADPAVDGFGSTRFKAEVPGLTFNDHSHYYDPGSESLYSMADIASGHGDALERHGMTAPHRDTALGQILEASGIPGASDPELYRPGTSGHYHHR